MKCVLHCLLTLRNAGAQSFIMNLYRKLNHQEYRFDFLLRCAPDLNDEELIDEIQSYGGRIYETSSFPKHAWKNYKELKEFMKQHASEYSAIHVHANSMLYVAPLYLSAKYGIPVRIIHSHNSKALKNIYTPIHSFNKCLYLKYATTLVACSNLAGVWMFGDKKYILAKNGIDLKKFTYCKQLRKQMREKLGLGDAIVIGNIGRFTKQKNHRFIISIYTEYCKRNPNSILLLVGIGELEESIRELVKKNNLQDKVIFMGLQRKIERIYQVLDIFLMPSYYEGLPFALVEAQAAGVPCIVSSTISKDTLVTEHLSVCRLEDPPEIWVEEIEKLASVSYNRDTYQIMKDNGFDIETNVELFSKIYNSY